METVFLLLFWGVPIVIGFIFGQLAEKRHYRSIHAREKDWLHLPTTAGRFPVTAGEVARCELVTGGTVVAADYFKRAAAGLRTIIGGPVKSHESLLDRAKREAVLRLKENCRGAHEIVNLRLETAPLSTSSTGGIGAVEVLLTALRSTSAIRLTMRYTPSLPERNNNVAQEHPLKDFLLILGALAALALFGLFLLGLLIDAVVDRMAPGTEAALTRLIAANIAAAETKAPGQLQRQMQLQALVDSLRPCIALVGPAQVRLTDSDTPNAMVVPGGTMVVFSGLLDHVQSENGLAFVLAHELAHLAHRDHLRALGRGIVLYGLAALVTGDNSALAGVLAPARHLGESSYSRTRESAADALALRVLNCRYGHVGGATEFFDALRDKQGSEVPGSHFIASHPAMDARIAALHAAMAAAGMKTGRVRTLAVGTVSAK